MLVTDAFNAISYPLHSRDTRRRSGWSDSRTQSCIGEWTPAVNQDISGASLSFLECWEVNSYIHPQCAFNTTPRAPFKLFPFSSCRNRFVKMGVPSIRTHARLKRRWCVLTLEQKSRSFRKFLLASEVFLHTDPEWQPSESLESLIKNNRVLFLGANEHFSGFKLQLFETITSGSKVVQNVS